jgi:hypothetical protein
MTTDFHDFPQYLPGNAWKILRLGYGHFLFDRHHYYRNGPFWAIVFFRGLDYSVLTSLDFSTVIFLRSKVVSLVSNPQPWGPDPCVFMSPSDTVAQLYPPGTGFPFRRLLLFAGLRWGYSNPSQGLFLSYTSSFISRPTIRCWKHRYLTYERNIGDICITV